MRKGSSNSWIRCLSRKCKYCGLRDLTMLIRSGGNPWRKTLQTSSGPTLNVELIQQRHKHHQVEWNQIDGGMKTASMHASQVAIASISKPDAVSCSRHTSLAVGYLFASGRGMASTHTWPFSTAPPLRPGITMMQSCLFQPTERCSTSSSVPPQGEASLDTFSPC